MHDIEEFETNEVAHKRLLSAVTKLDKTQHIKHPVRNEPTNLNSEFNLIKTSNKIDISNVVQILGSTASHVQITKSLKKTQDSSTVLQKPLEKPQALRVKRSTGYDEAKKRVGRWDAVVARSRTVDCVYFPLKQGVNKLQPTEEFISKLELKSPLELELDEVDPPPAVEEESEEEPVYPLTYQEMVEQRQHLAKIRAQQSFKAAKAKRQSKIKSKKYHRILKKDKLKQQLKEFEELQKTDPEEALKKLDALEKERALERHTLRHKNTGKWAKSKLIRAKYDKEVRQELAEQLAVSRNLTKKTEVDESTDDEATDECIPDIQLSQDPMNPWMMKQMNKSNVDKEFDFGYKKYLNERMLKRKADSDSDSCNGVEEKTKELPKTGIQPPVTIPEKMPLHINECDVEKFFANDTLPSSCVNSKKVRQPKKHSKVIATSRWIVEDTEVEDDKLAIVKSSDDISNAFDSLESDLAQKVELKLKQLRAEFEMQLFKKDSGDSEKVEDTLDNVEYLQFKATNKKAVIDEELIESANKEPDLIQIDNSLKVLSKPVSDGTSTNNIDPSKFLQAKPKYLNTALPGSNNNFDQLDDEEQVVPKVNIEEVFEEDDVVASFRQEKEDEANKDNPKDIDLTLPGWGTWGGKGVQAPKRKRNRFIMKGAAKVPRRDENKGDIIMKEYKNPKLQVHKIVDVPFPFTSVKEFEASIRAPLGNTFIPEKAHRKVIKPGVVTKAGTIIEPMDENELLVQKNRAYKNKSVIQLLAKNKKQK